MSEIKSTNNVNIIPAMINSEIIFPETESDDESLFLKEEQKPNGILEDFNQDKLGDCGLISTLISFKNSETGSKIIKDAISETNNGHSVYFKGINKAIEITSKELEEAMKSGYAKGKDNGIADSDAVLLELAFEKVCDEKPSSLMRFKHIVNDIFSKLHLAEDKYENQKSIVAESPYYFMELLTGKKSKMVTNL